MRITATSIGKRFNREWIFRDVNLEWQAGKCYAILGSNGSGKSTLLQILSGFVTPSEGTLTFEVEGKKIEPKQVFRQVAIAAPYLDLFEDMTLRESLTFHMKLKPFRGNPSVKEVVKTLLLEGQENKAVRNFSSGMRQRLRLGLAILSDTPVLLLDEPTSNLDANGSAWYRDLVAANRSDRLIIICSNRLATEYDFRDKEIVVEDYKS